MANKDRQIEKRNQEMARRKAEAEAREAEMRMKKKKRILIACIAAALVVAIACGVGIPLGVRQHNQYMEVNFRNLPVPTTVSEAQQLPQYNHRKVKLEGYTFPCTSIYYVLCKTAVSACPYVAGAVPNNGVRMEMKDGSRFQQLGQNAHVRVYATMEINTRNVELFEGYETYMYLVVDKIETIA